MAGTRITQSMMTRQILGDLNEVAQRLSSAQSKMSSGKEITRPSDNPFAVSRAISLRDDLEGTRQYQRTVSEALAWNQVTETALARVGDVMKRAKELVIQGANDAVDGIARENLATEIDQLVEAAKDQMNAEHAGRYVFSGQETNLRPYNPGAVDTYVPTVGGAIAREIGPGVAVQVNVLGTDVLGEGQLPAPGDDKLLDVLRDVAQHLRGNTAADLAALRDSDMQRLDANFDELLRIRAEVGAVTGRLDTAQASLSELEETTLKLLSETEDADMVKTLVDFTTQQTVYQSALRAGAQVVQASLLDFLR
jgi:flagellar hook-associated protein 3 FlgL